MVLTKKRKSNSKRKRSGGSYEMRVQDTYRNAYDKFIDDIIDELNSKYRGDYFGIESTIRYFLENHYFFFLFKRHEKMMEHLKIDNKYDSNKIFEYAAELTNLVWERLINNYEYMDMHYKTTKPEKIIQGIFGYSLKEKIDNYIKKIKKDNKLMKQIEKNDKFMKTIKKNDKFMKRIYDDDQRRKQKNQEKINHKKTNPIESNLFQKVIKKTKKLFRKHGRLYNTKKTWQGKLKNKLYKNWNQIPLLNNYTKPIMPMESSLQYIDDEYDTSLYPHTQPQWYKEQFQIKKDDDDDEKKNEPMSYSRYYR
jgi:hypothetical protein